MSTSVLITGSGKMARSIGLYFVQTGFKVSWFSRSKDRAESLGSYLNKQIRRLSDAHQLNSVAVYSPDNLPEERNYDICIESIEESVDAKKDLIVYLEKTFSFQYLFSNSSSIVPSRLHPRCIGLHFFYPVQVHPVAEVIFQNDITQRKEIEELLRMSSLELIFENELNAFAANRLLLPVQIETINALKEGLSPDLVDASTSSELLGIGQIRMMTSIGRNLIAESVRNYKTFNDPLCDNELQTLINYADILPEKAQLQAEKADPELRKQILYLLINTCMYFIENCLLSKEQVNSLIDLVFGADKNLQSIITAEGRDVMYNHLEKWFKETGRTYYKPSRLLSTDNEHRDDS